MYVKYIFFTEDRDVNEIITRNSEERPKEAVNLNIDLLWCALKSNDVLVVVRSRAVTRLLPSFHWHVLQGC